MVGSFRSKFYKVPVFVYIHDDLRFVLAIVSRVGTWNFDSKLFLGEVVVLLTCERPNDCDIMLPWKFLIENFAARIHKRVD